MSWCFTPPFVKSAPRAAIALSLALALCAGAVPLAFAGPNATLVRVKGVHLALPDKGTDTEFITFLNEAGRPALTLREVLAAPDVAEDYFKAARSIRVHIQPAPKPGQDFLGLFNRTDLRSIEIELTIGAQADTIHQAWSQQIANMRALALRTSATAQVDGWARIGDPTHPTDVFYIAQSAGKHAQQQDDLRCDDLRHCRSTRRLAPNVTLTYQFSDHAFDRAHWPVAIAYADSLAQRVILTRFESNAAAIGQAER